jgi:DNA repair exonuclease SbcCD ATPase subunit
MLVRLKLENFRKAVSEETIFTPGINLFRGVNEAGKTTRLEAISYALFGSRSLRTPLEQCVTWGTDVKKLRVTLVLTAGGVKHTFTRSKSGAEVRLNDSDSPFVTGQTEVSNFAASLLGADASTANSLLMASQNRLRGALEEGPKALSQMIEDLAGFDTFDRILEAASKKLALGSASLLEAQLKGAENTLAAATANLPAKPDEDAHALSLKALEAKAAAIEASLPSLRELAKTAVNRWQEASDIYLRKRVMAGKVDELLRNVGQAQDQVSILTKNTDKVVDVGQIEVLKARIVEAEGHAARVAAYIQFLSIPEGPVWKGDKSSFDMCRNICQTKISQLEKEAIQLRFDVKTLNSQRFDSTTCSKCGQALPDIDNIVATNTAIDKKLVEIATLLAANEVNLALETKDRGRFNNIEAHAKRLESIYKKLIGYCLFDDDQYPARAVWDGTKPDGFAPDVSLLRQQLTAVEAEVKALETSRAQLAWAKEQLDKIVRMYNEAEIVLREFVAPSDDDTLALTTDKDKALGDVSIAEGEAYLIRHKAVELDREFQVAVRMWDMAKERVNDANKTIEACKADLASLGFNNALVAKLRKIRPVIANKLWNTVLASVSVMFSQMRKEESWVTKDSGGFKVNGQAVESLSGSTLDILGLSVRCALLRTFLPQCGLLVLDEPCASMDDGRTESLLGFLKSVGFQQTLLVSHEEVSESVADNLIQL